MTSRRTRVVAMVIQSRLHEQGEVIGRGIHLLYVRFRDETVALRPDLVRVLTTPDGG